MPELPDVEGFKRYYARHAAGRRVREISVPAPAILRNTNPKALDGAVRDRTLRRPSRRGKWMLAPVADRVLLFHFGMTGFFEWSSRPGERHRHDRLVLRLAGGELRYRNMRMLGGVWLATEDGVDAITGTLGPDAASISKERFDAVLADARGGIKALLMNQRRIAGIGNELSDEILWRARVHPRRQVPELGGRERRRVFDALEKVIATSNRHGRIPTGAGWFKSQRGGRKPRCPRCAGAVRRTTVAGRTSYWCPRCQPSPD